VGRPYSSLPVLEPAYKKAGEGLFTRAGSDRTRVTASSWKRADLD